MNPQRRPTHWLILCGFITFNVSGIKAGDWPNLRGPSSDGIVNEKLAVVAGKPEVLWEAEGPRGGGGVVVAGGLAISCGTGNLNIVCLNVESGKLLWSKTNFPEWHGNHTPALAQRVMYLQAIAHGAPKAFCFEAATGNEIWSRELPAPDGERPYGHAGSPLIVGNLVIFNAGGGVALNRRTGEVVWSHEGLPGLATPTLFTHAGQQAVALFLGDRAIARDLKSGTKLWSIPWKTDLAVNAHHPLVFDGKLLINSDYGMGRALYDISVSPPQELWKFERGSGHAYAASLIHESMVYGFFENSLACLNPTDGSLVWKAKPNSGSILLIGDQIVCLSESGVLTIGNLSRQEWKPTMEERVLSGETRNNPAYTDGKLIIKNSKGKIVCLRIAS